MKESIRDFLLHKLSLRVGYFIAAYVSSNVLSLLVSEKVQAELPKMGAMLQITDPEKFRDYVYVKTMFAVMLVGEFVYHFAHNKFVLPKVAPIGNSNLEAPTQTISAQGEIKK